MLEANPLLLLYCALTGLFLAAELILAGLNAAHHRSAKLRLPTDVETWLENPSLTQRNRYLLANLKLGTMQLAISRLLLLGLILTGFMPWLATRLEGLPPWIAGLLFLAILAWLGLITKLPFTAYRTLVLETRYGFNTQTWRGWLLDAFKSLLLSTALGTGLTGVLLILMHWAGQGWWLLAWLLYSSFLVLLTIIYPTVIAPLFNRFTTIGDPELVAKIKQLAAQTNIRLEGIYQMDATRRTRHTNAYVSGWGKTKKIVLYDGLLQSHDTDEICAVLAHEIGHVKQGHIAKSLVNSSLAALLFFWMTATVMERPVLWLGFGFVQGPPHVILLAALLWWVAMVWMAMPLRNAVTRRFEYAADRYAVAITGHANSLIKALCRLAKDNLSDLNPHPLYAWFYCTHPALLERINALKTKAERIDHRKAVER